MLRSIIAALRSVEHRTAPKAVSRLGTLSLQTNLGGRTRVNRIETALSSFRIQALPLRQKACAVRATATARQLSVKDKAAQAQSGSGPFDIASWRQHTEDLRWHWDAKAPVQNDAQVDAVLGHRNTCSDLASCAVQVLRTKDPAEKIALTHTGWRKLVTEGLGVGTPSTCLPNRPARPDQPELVPVRDVPPAKKSGVPLNVYMLLNLAHVELNAIDLAWDTVARFADARLPQEFYRDFAHVAEDESRHLGWCLQRLEELGHAYGDICAHNQLWDGAEASSGSLAGRLVVVPCSQEARGLDAGPRLVERLTSMVDHPTAAIVNQISKEELAHVAVGSYWLRLICSAMKVEAGSVFRSCINSFCPDILSGNYNHAARKNAGLEQDWYDRQLWPAGDGTEVSAHTLQLTPEQLAELHERLTTVLDLELSNS